MNYVSMDEYEYYRWLLMDYVRLMYIMCLWNIWWMLILNETIFSMLLSWDNLKLNWQGVTCINVGATLLLYIVEWTMCKCMNMNIIEDY